jgi:hypothetical protein
MNVQPGGSIHLDAHTQAYILSDLQPGGSIHLDAHTQAYIWSDVLEVVS